MRRPGRSRGFDLLADQALAMCNRAQQPAVIVAIDLDGFKEINDDHGHHAGDEALRSFAELMLSSFRDSDVIARTGGDEFCALLTGATVAEAQVVLRRLEEAVDAHNLRQNNPYTLQFSAGTASYMPEAGTELARVLRAADADMYTNKKHNKSARQDNKAVRA